MADDSTVGSAYVEIRPDTRQFEQQLTSQLRGLAGPFSAAMSGLASAGTQALTAMTTSAVALGTAFAGVTAAGVSMGFKTGAELETARLQFEVLLGSADRAGTRIEELFDFAAKTPYETTEVINASRLLQTFGGDALAASENLTLVGDAAAGASRPLDEVAFWVGRAYAAIQGGQPFGEASARLQEMAILTPQARAEMEALQKSGASADEVFAVLTGSLGKFQGTMEKLATTLPGLQSTLSDLLNIGSEQIFAPWYDSTKQLLTNFIDIANSGVGTAIIGLGQALTTTFNPVDKLNQVITQLADKIDGPAVEAFTQRLIPALMGAQDALMSIAPLAAGVGVALASSFGRAIPIVGGLLPAISPLIGIMGGLVLGTDAGRDALGRLGGEFQSIAQTAGPAVLGALQAITENGGRALAGLMDALAPTIGEIGRVLLPAFADAIADMAPPLGDVVIALGDMLAAVGPPLASALGGLISVGAPLLTGFLSVLAPVLGAIADAAEPLAPLLISLGAAFVAFKTVGILKDGLMGLQGLMETAAIKVMYLGDQLKGAGAAAGGAGGLAGGLSGMLNPAMLGITVATVGVTMAFQQWQKRKQELKQLTQDFTSAVRDETQAVDASARAATEKQLADKNQIDDLNDMEVSYDQWTAAIQGNVQAQQDIRRAMLESGQVELDMRGWSKEARDEAINGFIRENDANGARILKNKGITDSLRDQTNAYATASEAQLNSLVASKELTEAERDAIVTRHTGENGVIDWGNALEDARLKTQGLTDAQVAQKDALDETQKKYKELVDPLFAVEQQTQAYQQNLLDLNDALTGQKVSLDLSTEAGQSFRGEALAGAQQAFQLAEAMRANGATNEEAAAKVHEYAGALASTMRQANIAEPEIISYLQTLGLTPEAINTILGVETEQAIANLEAARAKAQELYEIMLNLGNTSSVYAPGGSGGGGTRFYAEGGTAPAGTWGVTGEDGPELTYFGQDTHIIPHAESMAMLGEASGGGGMTFNGPVTFGADMATATTEMEWWYRTSRVTGAAR